MQGDQVMIANETKSFPAGHAACTALIPWESWDLMTATQSLVKEFQSLVKELWGTLLVVFTLEIFRNR